MDKEALYWVLSTIPQVSAALVAFIGFLVMSSLDEPTRKRERFENLVRQDLMQKLETTNTIYKRFAEVGKIEVMPADTLMDKIEFLITMSPPIEHLQKYHVGWKPLNQWVKKVRRWLGAFVFCHLFIIAGSLCSLPFSPSISGLPYILFAIIVCIVVLAVSSGVMIFTALYRPRL